MKNCPACKRTYPDNAPPFCAEDGTRLINAEEISSSPQHGQMMSSDFSNISRASRSPKETSQAIREAMRRKDLDEIKRLYSRNAMRFLHKKAQSNYTSVDDEILSLINQAPKIDQYGDEIIKGNKAIVKVRTGDTWNKQPFIKEDGEWKLDVSFNPSGLVKALVIGIVPAFLIMFLVVGILFFVFGFAMKWTDTYACAVSEAKRNPIVIEQLGEPIETGFFAWSFSYSKKGSTEDAHFNTNLTGPKGTGTLYVDSYRSPVGSSLRMVMEKDGQDYNVYNGAFQCR